VQKRQQQTYKNRQAIHCTCVSIKSNRFNGSCLAKFNAWLSVSFPLLLDDMILTETLFPHLWEIDETAHRRVEQIMTELLEKNPAPDKSTQQLAWVQHMSSLKTQAEEIVNAELIFC